MSEPRSGHSAPAALSVRWACVCAVGLCLVAGACAWENPNEDLEHLNGLFVADDGIYVAADRFWSRYKESGGRFHRVGALVVRVENTRADELVVNFAPDKQTRRFRFMAAWDDEAIWEKPRSAADGPVAVRIDARHLSPGTHRLALARVLDPGSPRRLAKQHSRFNWVTARWTVAGETTTVPVELDSHLARFFDFGVIPTGSTHTSGSLFIGRQQHEFDIEAKEDARLVFDLKNLSSRPARFLMSADAADPVEVEVGPGGEERAGLPVSPGTHRIELDTEGEPRGMFLWGAPQLEPDSRLDLPPVIVITLDTTRRDVVAPYSGRPDWTPNLAEFARQGTVFTNAHAVAPWTLPSHVSIFTGLYPSHHRVGVADDGRVENHLTLAKRFRVAGYRTAGFAGGYLASSDFGMAHGFSRFRDPRNHDETADVITDAAIDFIETNAASPLFLFLNYFDPHAVYDAPEPFQAMHDVATLAEELRGLPLWQDLAEGRFESWPRVARGEAPLDEAGLAFLRATYRAEVSYMDSEIGRLFDTLREHGLYDDALIVLVADHGEHLGERGIYTHSYRLDRELIDIPLLIKWPGQTQAAVVDGLTSQVDLYPTIARAVGLEVPQTDGVVFERGATAALNGRERVYMEEHRGRYHQLQGSLKIADHLFGIQQLDFREVFYPGTIECEARTNGRWAPADCSAAWVERFAELPVWMQDTVDLTDFGSAEEINEEDAEKLRALGYLE